MFQICGAFAEFERSMIQQRIKAGLTRAIAKGVKVGRPKVPATVEREVRRRLGGGGEGIVKIARSMGIGTGVVARIKKEMTNGTPA
jgi:DNA invertase Pin-like site-specific DNA recombinase